MLRVASIVNVIIVNDQVDGFYSDGSSPRFRVPLYMTYRRGSNRDTRRYVRYTKGLYLYF
jgi:hypothetical protein